MPYYNLMSNKVDIRCPEMDLTEAVRRILAILNDNSPPAPAAGTVGGGSTTSVGGSFHSVANVVIDGANQLKQFPTIDTPRGVLLVARLGNTNAVCIGGSGVTAATGSQAGITLTQAGMTSVVLPVQNLNQLYINGATAGDGVGVVIL